MPACSRRILRAASSSEVVVGEEPARVAVVLRRIAIADEEHLVGCDDGDIGDELAGQAVARL
jgi:hypothetical protein